MKYLSNRRLELFKPKLSAVVSGAVVFWVGVVVGYLIK
jgi:hypothetical protein